VLSTQFPEAHSSLPVQRAPSALLPQLPVAVSQTLPAMQSASDAHIVLQVLVAASQRKLPQLCIWPAGHIPAPSQFAALINVEAFAGQEAARHMVLVPHLRQAPMPLQKPSLPQVASAEAGQPP